MIKTNETFCNTEQQLDIQSIETLYSSQAEMLLAIENDIPTELFDKLYAKMEEENELLLKIITGDEKVAESRKYINRTLKSKYFLQKHLDTNLI